MLADAPGRPLRFILTAGQVNEITQADKGYDSAALRQTITDRGMTAVIPTIRTRKIQVPYDKEAYKLRNRIERCFARLKSFRRIATRYDRRAAHFPASLHLVASLLWMR